MTRIFARVAGIVSRLRPDPLPPVRAVLQSYADRGVFRSFGELEARNGRAEFRFLWLWREPFRLLVDPRRGILTFRDLLPHVPARSRMDADLRSFLKERCSPSVPDHRRIDPERARITCYNRDATVSISLKMQTVDDLEYGVGKLINLVNDVFMTFLHRAAYYEYVAETFEVVGE